MCTSVPYVQYIECSRRAVRGYVLSSSVQHAPCCNVQQLEGRCGYFSAGCFLRALSIDAPVMPLQMRTLPLLGAAGRHPGLGEITPVQDRLWPSHCNLPFQDTTTRPPDPSPTALLLLYGA